MEKSTLARIFRFGLVILVTSAELALCSETLDEKMKNDPDISQFYNLMSTSKLARVTLQYKPATIFAPINAAFQKFDTNGVTEKEALVLYHITSVPKKTPSLGNSYTSLNSEVAGNPPLWITHITGRYHDDVYVNNARILVSQSNIEASGQQVLHKIDEVLVPTRSPSTATNLIYNPTAWEFLENYESLISQTPHRLRNFRQKVQQNSKQDIYRTEGGHTFFIPVDEGFANDRAALIDAKIIDGHVIPNSVLFTTPTKKDVPFQTLASGDNDIRVLISFTQEQSGTEITNYVKSHTVFGDSGKHTPGVVLAEIVKANIPVKNGVIHLIQKPLMVVDSTVKKLLEYHVDFICNVGNVARQENFVEPDHFPENGPNSDIEKDGYILNKFLSAIKQQGDQGEEFLKILERSHDVTLFAPCNSVLENDLAINSILNDRDKFMDILKLHLIVDDRLYLEKISKLSKNGVFQVPSFIKGKNLYFNVVATKDNRTLTVEGGGVNATVIQPDLAATNGIIHVIDRVLGVPYSTVLQKLSTDPSLKSSYALGNIQGFNTQLNDTMKKFTYFVPSDKAWLDAKVALPSAIKKLFMREYSYHATVTLERHLVIANEAYTMERLKQMTTQNSSTSQHHQQHGSSPYGTYGKRLEVELPTMRGSLRINVEERIDNTFIINWRGEKIPVFRANVECTNGIIHVIDAPFLKEGDIQVNGAQSLSIASQLVMIILARILLL